MKGGLILPPRGIPQLGGPEQSQAIIGGLRLEFFADPNVAVQIPAPASPDQLPGFFAEIAGRATVAAACINAFCREFVVQRERIEQLTRQVEELHAHVASLEANAITKVERIEPGISAGDSGELKEQGR